MSRPGVSGGGRAQGRPGGFTLVELVTALAIASILFLALGNAVYIATKALPGKDDPAANSVVAARVMDQIASELEEAVHIRELTSSGVAFSVADRDGDGINERIGYSWSGNADDPLVRTYNGVSWAVIDRVHTFNLVANCRHVGEEYTEPGVEDASPSTLADLSVLLGTGVATLSGDSRVNLGQYFRPQVMPGVIAWRPTGVRVWAMLDRTPGSFRAQLREASASMVPRLGVLEERVVSSSALTFVMLPQTYSYSTVGRQAAGNPICFTLLRASGLGPGKFQTSTSNPHMLSTSSGATDWSVASDKSLASILYGVAMRAGSSTSATTRFAMSIGVSLGAGPSGGPVLTTTALTLNHPELLRACWELTFERDPTATDANADGVGDWTLDPPGSFDKGRVSDGVWTASSESLSTSPANDFTGITIVDLRMQSISPGAAAGFAINAARSGDASVGLVAKLVLETDGTQTLAITQDVAGTPTPLITFSQLPAQPTDIRLIVDPDSMGVAVSINGADKGTLPITSSSRPAAARTASVYASGGQAKIWYARVRELGDQP